MKATQRSVDLSKAWSEPRVTEQQTDEQNLESTKDPALEAYYENLPRQTAVIKAAAGLERNFFGC